MSDEDKIKNLQQAVEDGFGCQAAYEKTSRVVESFEGSTVWQGDVMVFRVTGREDADTAYAWLEDVNDTDHVRVFTVLGRKPVNTANEAVRAALIQRYREETGRA